MKRFLSFALVLSLLFCMSVCAFAADDAADEADPVEDVSIPEDVSVDSDKVTLGALTELPETLKAEAEKLVSRMSASGYTIISGFGVWSEAPEKSFCTVKLPVSEVPKGADIYINGQALMPEAQEDGYFYFDVPLDAKLTKSIVIIAMRPIIPDTSPVGTETAQPAPYYPSPTAGTP